jgi:hypothetical protein
LGVGSLGQAAPAHGVANQKQCGALRRLVQEGVRPEHLAAVNSRCPVRTGPASTPRCEVVEAQAVHARHLEVEQDGMG